MGFFNFCDARVQCLPEPLEPQYGGGILRNADFSAGLRGWSTFGYGSIAESKSAAGNGFAVALNRTRPYQSVSQKVYLQRDTHYTLSGAIHHPDPSRSHASFVMMPSRGWKELIELRSAARLYCSVVAGRRRERRRPGGRQDRRRLRPRRRRRRQVRVLVHAQGRPHRRVFGPGRDLLRGSRNS